jgi:ceramide glucosyltransferase
MTMMAFTPANASLSLAGGLAWLLLAVAAVGLLCSTGFLVLAVVAAGDFRRRARNRTPLVSADLPAVTLFKPLCGPEPNLESNLASFFEQDYPSFEIVFGARDSSDPAIDVACGLSRRYPQVVVKFVFSGEPRLANAKVWSWQKMYAVTENEFLIISDSDVSVGRNYIRSVIAPLMERRVGLVTCIYRGVPTAGFWSRLEALGYSVEMTSGVIVANLLEGMKFALGPTMATRRDVIASIGGVEAVGDYYADDYVLGNRIYEAGQRVLLSTEVIEHVGCHRGLKASFEQQIRWMRSTRFSRPAGHFSSVLTFAMPFGILGLVAGSLAGSPALGWSLLASAIVNRMLLAIVAGWGVVADRRSLLYCWLYPLRDLMGFTFWCASYAGREIVWRRGERYRIQAGGSMLRVDADLPQQAQDRPLPGTQNAS